MTQEKANANANGIGNGNGKASTPNGEVIEMEHHQTQVANNNNNNNNDKSKRRTVTITEDQGGSRSTVHMISKELTVSERNYLLAVDKGDTAAVRLYLEDAEKLKININCVDPWGRTALQIAINNDNADLVRLLLSYEVEIRDGLLHAISEGNVLIVQMIVQVNQDRAPVNKKIQKLLGENQSPSYPPEITPLMLACHCNDYQIIKLLLDRGDTLEKPHDIQCSCKECVNAKRHDGLKYSLLRFYSFKALSSPALISLTSKDPILTAFELSLQLSRLADLEPEWTNEYNDLAQKCRDFGTDLLNQVRGSLELDIVLNHEAGAYEEDRENLWKDELQDMEFDDRIIHQKLARLKLALKYEQKAFVANSACQQLLTSMWYHKFENFRSLDIVQQLITINAIGCCFPGLAFAYLFWPEGPFGKLLKLPFVNFICHSASYNVFLLVQILDSLHLEYLIENIAPPDQPRGAAPTYLEWILMVFIAGTLWQKISIIIHGGPRKFLDSVWNIFDSVVIMFFLMAIGLRIGAYKIQQDLIRMNSTEATAPRYEWNGWDPTMISECFKACANIVSILRLIYMFSFFQALGTLQISFAKILGDVLKFFVMFFIVLFAFACGFNQLLWYYGKEWQDECTSVAYDSEPCIKAIDWANLFQILQTLYWAIYFLVELPFLYVGPGQDYTYFVTKLMFGIYIFITVTVLLTMLIAMMNYSYAVIIGKADLLWKYERTSLWMNYFETSQVVPVPFNMIPGLNSMKKLIKFIKTCNCEECHSKKAEQAGELDEKARRRLEEKQALYEMTMSDLIKRYLVTKHYAHSKEHVTEDDLSEFRQELWTFRYDLFDIFRANGMVIPNPAITKQTRRQQQLLQFFKVEGQKLIIHKQQAQHFKNIAELVLSRRKRGSVNSEDGEDSDSQSADGDKKQKSRFGMFVRGASFVRGSGGKAGSMIKRSFTQRRSSKNSSQRKNNSANSQNSNSEPQTSASGSQQATTVTITNEAL